MGPPWATVLAGKYLLVSVFPGIKPQHFPNGIKSNNIKSNSIMKVSGAQIWLCTYKIKNFYILIRLIN